MKKLFIFMAAVVLALAVGCQTGTDSDTGKDSDKSKESAAFTYEVTDEGTICITGLTDESVSELVIPKKIDGKQVTEIKRYAFYDCENLKSVELPSVEKIGKAAFSGCKNLESVSMPKVETIEGKAFLDCAKLTQVELPEEVEIADNAFDGCDSLTQELPTTDPEVDAIPTPKPTEASDTDPLPTPTATPTTADTAGSTNDKQFKNAKVGETVVFGSYEQDANTSNGKEEIEWLVLEKTEDRMLVISKYALDCQPYNEKYAEVTWETCTLRSWLNKEFLNAAFTTKEQKRIPTVTVTAEDNPYWRTDAGNDTKDKVFLLSISEAKEYFANAAARMCEPTAYAEEQGVYVSYDYSSTGSCFWWLRSPGGDPMDIAFDDICGRVDHVGSGVNVSAAVRPALWINLNADATDKTGTESTPTPKPTATPTPTATADSTNDKQFKNAKVGETVVFGSYEQDADTSNGKEEIEWLVLEKTEDRMLVISKYALDYQPYNADWVDVTWETCTLRSWLNNEFLNTAFMTKEQKRIPTVTVTAEDNPRYGTDAGNDTKDKVFLLSISEVEEYFADDAARMCEPTAYAEEQGVYVSYDYSSTGSCFWWLRSPGGDSNIALVDTCGDVDLNGYGADGYDIAVRPALWINLNADATDKTGTYENVPTPTTADSTNDKQFKNAKVGETVVFGSYEQDNNTSNGKEEIEWLVLEKTEDRMLVISKYGLDCQPYNETYDDVTWETCTLRKWLNNDFLNTAFTDKEQKRIPTVTVSVKDNPSYGTDAGNDTKDKVFLLSISEAKEYFADNAVRMCEPTAYAVEQGAYVDYDYSSSGSCCWWLRSPGYDQGIAAGVYVDGNVDNYGGYVDFVFIAVRPALWINLNADATDKTGTYENVPTPTTADTAGSTNDKQFKNANVGETVVFGSYEQDADTSNGKEEIEWLVLEKTEDRMLVISKYGLDCQRYNEELEDVTWETCTLRSWLNNEFLNTAFTTKEQKRIPTVTVTAEDNPDWGTDAGNDTKDKVFLLSISEAEEYFADAAARKCKPTAYAEEQGASSSGSCCWWLRSPGKFQDFAAYVYNVGYFAFLGNVYFDTYAVRPALWINLNP